MNDCVFMPTSPLSNYWIIPGGMIWGGLVWLTSEHAYQAGKYIYENSPENNNKYLVVIQSQPSPSKAKCVASQKTMKYLTNLQPLIDGWKPYVKQNPNWDLCKIDVMRSVLKAKWDHSEIFRETLISTGDSVIKEYSQYDYFWGTGQNGTGLNKLGLLLMELRDSKL